MQIRIPNLAVFALAFAAAIGAACAEEPNPCTGPAFEVEVLQEAHRSVDVPLDPKAFDGPDAHPGEIPMGRTLAPVPGQGDLCVYAASWIAIEPGERRAGQYDPGRVRLYVATYGRDSGEKRGEISQDVEVENL